MRKLNKFQSFIYSNSYEIVCITETWLSDAVFDNEIIPKNYSIYRKDRKSRGGGVLVAISDSISSNLIPSPNTLELIAVSINRGVSFVLCCIYIAPNSDSVYCNSLLLYLHQLINSYTHTVLVGDFNVPDINWGSLTGTSSFSISFCDFVFQHNLTQFVNQPTHIKGNILDLVFTNSDELIHNLHVFSPCHSLFSDHSIISFHLQTAKLVLPSVKPRFVFDFPKANLDGLYM